MKTWTKNMSEQDRDKYTQVKTYEEIFCAWHI